MKYQIHTFGCKVNTYDAGLIQKNLSQGGYSLLSARSESSESGQIHVLNTCAVTGEATKEAVRVIRRIKAKDPLATIVVTGCAAQVDTDSFANLPGADLVVANSHKGLLPFLLDQYFKGEIKDKVFKSNIFRKEDLEAGGGLEESHTRSFLKIQDGCNSFCTYCIIPYARGKSRSIPMKDLALRINELYDQGIRETVLTGVHVGDYQDEQRPLGQQNLEHLLEYILKNTKMPRLRLTSLEPVEVTDHLIQIYQDERMCKHFHMSIQSADSFVLEKMKRNYTQKEVIESLEKIEKKVPGSFVGMDVIVGFPVETDELFEETYRVLSHTPWTRLHVFPYSERPGTRAAVMPEVVPMNVRKNRAQKLRELSLHRYQSEALKQMGLVKKVLILKNEARGVQGLSRDFWPIQVQGESEIFKKAGTEVDLKVSGYNQPENLSRDGSLVCQVDQL